MQLLLVIALVPTRMAAAKRSVRGRITRGARTDSLHPPCRHRRHRVLHPQVHFPAGGIPSLAQAVDWMERCGLELLDGGKRADRT